MSVMWGRIESKIGTEITNQDRLEAMMETSQETMDTKIDTNQEKQA
jgi:hypothetical protein